MLAKRDVNVDHSTIYRRVQRYAPEMEKRFRWYWRNPSDLCPWHMDETYVKVDARLMLNTDRLSTGITSLNVSMAN